MSEIKIYTVRELLDLFVPSDPPANFAEFGDFGSAECIQPLEEDKYLLDQSKNHQKRPGTELPFETETEKRQQQPQHYNRNRNYQNQQQNQNQQKKQQQTGPKKFTPNASSVKVEKGFDDIQISWGVQKKEEPAPAPAPAPVEEPKPEPKPESKPEFKPQPAPKTTWSQVNAIPEFTPQPAKEEEKPAIPVIPAFDPVRKPKNNNFNPALNKFMPYNHNSGYNPYGRYEPRQEQKTQQEQKPAPAPAPAPKTAPKAEPAFNPKPAARAAETPATEEKKEQPKPEIDEEFPSFGDLEPKKQTKLQTKSHPQQAQQQKREVDESEWPSLSSAKPMTNQKKKSAWGNL